MDCRSMSARSDMLACPQPHHRRPQQRRSAVEQHRFTALPSAFDFGLARFFPTDTWLEKRSREECREEPGKVAGARSAVTAAARSCDGAPHAAAGACQLAISQVGLQCH